MKNPKVVILSGHIFSSCYLDLNNPNYSGETQNKMNYWTFD